MLSQYQKEVIMSKTKCKVSISINAEDASRMEAIAMSRSTNLSDVYGKAIYAYLKGSPELTSAERILYGLALVEHKIDGILAIIQNKHLYTLPAKMIALYNGLRLILPKSQAEKEYFDLELGFFEAVNDIRYLDTPLFKEMVSLMAKSGNMKQRFTQIYP